MAQSIRPASLVRDVAELMKANRRVGGAVSASQVPTPAKDRLVIATNGQPATWQLSAIPLVGDDGSSLNLSLNGLELDEATDYSVDYTTGIVTFSAGQQALFTATPTPADVLTADYLTSDEGIANTQPVDGGLAQLSDFTQDGGTWSLDAGNRFYVSASTPGPTRFQSSSLAWYMLRHDLGKASIDLTVDVNHVATSGAEQIFCAFDPTAGSGYAIQWDTTNTFNGGLTLYRYPSNTGTRVALGNATATPVDAGWGDASFTHTVHLRLTYDSSTGALAAYWGMDGATPTLRISATDATPLTGTWFGATEFTNNTSFGRWVNWAAS